MIDTIPHRIPRDSINFLSLSFPSIIFTSYTIHQTQSQCNQKICTVHSQQVSTPIRRTQAPRCPHPANDVTVLAAGQQGSSETTDALIKAGRRNERHQHQRSTTLKGPENFCFLPLVTFAFLFSLLLSPQSCMPIAFPGVVVLHIELNRGCLRLR